MSAAEDKLATLPGVTMFPKVQSRFRLEDFDTLERSALHWRVKGLWPAVGVCFLGGPSMSGKSFLALDWLAKVCRGEDVIGRRSIPCGVVYVAAEAAAGARTRIEGLRSRTGSLGGAFKFIGQPVNLLEPEDVADLRETLEEARADLEGRGLELGVICVDTLSASIPGADENSAKDMSPVLTALQAMAVELGAVVLVVAHTGKDEDRGLRGWSGLLANADGLVMLGDPKGEATRVGKVVKVKDGLSGDEFAFGLEVVQVGIDDDGDPITTCVVEVSDVPDRPRAGRKATVADGNARTLKQAFNRILPDKGARIDAAGANGALGVFLPDLRAEALGMGLGPPEPDYAGMDDAERAKTRKSWADHRNKSFARALDELRVNHGYRIENDWVWEMRANKGDSQ